MNNEDKEINRELYAIEQSLRKFADSLAEARGADGEGARVGEAARRMREQARYKWSEMQHKVKEGGRYLDKSARENPWQAVGIAAAVGAFVGALLTSQKRRGGNRG